LQRFFAHPIAAFRMKRKSVGASLALAVAILYSAGAFAQQTCCPAGQTCGGNLPTCGKR
jgi:hypothetical protein